MIRIAHVDCIEGKKQIAIMDTSSISFMQLLSGKNIPVEEVLKDYDLILIPGWVVEELNDAIGRMTYVQNLIDAGYPIYRIEEQDYSELVGYEEGNLYQIVLASTFYLARIRSYLRRYVEMKDSLELDSYQEWIRKLYDEWPDSGERLQSGRVRKKNAGEISITILAEVISWYYPETDALTIYTQDNDTYMYQRKAESDLRELFTERIPVPVAYKSNDAILCQLYRADVINIDEIENLRKNARKITYTRERLDHSVVLITEVMNNELFIELIKDKSLHIVF